MMMMMMIMMMMMMKVMTMIMIMNVADWALNLLLSVPARIIRQAHPLATHVTYMDDRSFAASSVSEVKSIWNLWTAHSADLCLKESKAKTQITCRQNAKRMMAALDDVVGPYIKDTIEVLGCNFSPGHSKPSPKEFRRFEIATPVTRRAGMAPVAADSRLFVACTTATAKASYGWVLRSPTKALSDKLETKLRSIGWDHKQAAPALVQLLAGHCTDTQFTSGFNCVAGPYQNHRLHNGPTCGWELKGGFAARCRKFLQLLGWEETGRWHWRSSEHHLSLFLGTQIFQVIRTTWAIFCVYLGAIKDGASSWPPVALKLALWLQQFSNLTELLRSAPPVLGYVPWGCKPMLRLV